MDELKVIKFATNERKFYVRYDTIRDKLATASKGVEMDVRKCRDRASLMIGKEMYFMTAAREVRTIVREVLAGMDEEGWGEHEISYVSLILLEIMGLRTLLSRYNRLVKQNIAYGELSKSVQFTVNFKMEIIALNALLSIMKEDNHAADLLDMTSSNFRANDEEKQIVEDYSPYCFGYCFRSPKNMPSTVILELNRIFEGIEQWKELAEVPGINKTMFSLLYYEMFLYTTQNQSMLVAGGVQHVNIMVDEKTPVRIAQMNNVSDCFIQAAIDYFANLLKFSDSSPLMKDVLMSYQKGLTSTIDGFKQTLGIDLTVLEAEETKAGRGKRKREKLNSPSTSIQKVKSKRKQ